MHPNEPQLQSSRSFRDPQITSFIKNPSELSMKDRQLMGDNEHALREEMPYNFNNAENRREVNSAEAVLGNVSVSDLEKEARQGRPTEISGDAMARARARKPAKIENIRSRETDKDRAKKNESVARRREIDEERRNNPGAEGMANGLSTGFDRNGRKSTL